MSDKDIPTDKVDQLKYSVSSLLTYGSTDSLKLGIAVNGLSALGGILIWHFIGGIVGIVGLAWTAISLFALIDGVIHA